MARLFGPLSTTLCNNCSPSENKNCSAKLLSAMFPWRQRALNRGRSHAANVRTVEPWSTHEHKSTATFSFRFLFFSSFPFFFFLCCFFPLFFLKNVKNTQFTSLRSGFTTLKIIWKLDFTFLFEKYFKIWTRTVVFRYFKIYGRYNTIFSSCRSFWLDFDQKMLLLGQTL